MATFDYCTAVEAFNYGGSAGEGTDPVNELDEMAAIVTSVSRAIDRRCLVTFYEDTYTDQRLRGKIDRDGVLTVALPTPAVSSLAGVSYQIGASLTWEAVDLSGADTEEHPNGCILRILNAGLLNYRGQRISIQASYTGGWADRDSLPDDFRLLARGAAWYEYQRRFAPQDKTSNPAMGIVVVPGDWPKHLRAILAVYTRQVAA